MGKTNDGILTTGEKTFRKILKFINEQGRNGQTPLGPKDLQNYFDSKVLQDIYRLQEKKFVEYKKERNCYYITDSGIAALETTYNPEWRRRQEEEKNEAKQIEERRHQEILAEQRKGNKRQWTGISIAGIIGFAGLIIALLK